MIEFDCPSCGKRYRVKVEAEGKKAKCKSCGTGIVVPANEVAPDDFENSILEELNAGVVETSGSSATSEPRVPDVEDGPSELPGTLPAPLELSQMPAPSETQSASESGKGYTDSLLSSHELVSTEVVTTSEEGRAGIMVAVFVIPILVALVAVFLGGLLENVMGLRTRDIFVFIALSGILVASLAILANHIYLAVHAFSESNSHGRLIGILILVVPIGYIGFCTYVALRWKFFQRPFFVYVGSIALLFFCRGILAGL